MRFFPVLVALAALTACEETATLEQSDIFTGPRGDCVPEITALAADDAGPAGFTAASVAAGVGGERATTLKYDATSVVTDLLVEVIAGGEMRWVDETWVPDPDYAEDTVSDENDVEPPSCSDRMEIDGTLRFVTADGAFAEEIPVVVVGTAEGVGRIDQAVSYEDLLGAYVPSEIDPAEWDAVRLEWAVNASAASVAGEVALFADRTGEEADGTAYDEGYANDMARFPAP